MGQRKKENMREQRAFGIFFLCIYLFTKRFFIGGVWELLIKTLSEFFLLVLLVCKKARRAKNGGKKIRLLEYLCCANHDTSRKCWEKTMLYILTGFLTWSIDK